MKFESAGARLYYTLGSAYYLFHWLLIAGGAGLGSALLLAWSAPIPASVVTVVSLGLIVSGCVAWIAKTKKRLDCLR